LGAPGDEPEIPRSRRRDDAGRGRADEIVDDARRVARRIGERTAERGAERLDRGGWEYRRRFARSNIRASRVEGMLQRGEGVAPWIRHFDGTPSVFCSQTTTAFETIGL